MDLGRAVGYPLRDPDWVGKLLIGAVLSFIPLVNILTFGYGLRATKKVMEGDDTRLPEWDDWGNDFVRGLLLWCGILIYYLPMTPIFCCLLLVSASTSNDNGDMNIGGVLMTMCLYGIVFVYSIAAVPLLAAASVRYAQYDKFTDAFLNFGFRFQEVRRNIVPTLLMLVYVAVVGAISGVLSGATFWICGLGLIIGFASNLIISHILGQYGIQLSEKAKNDFV